LFAKILDVRVLGVVNIFSGVLSKVITK